MQQFFQHKIVLMYILTKRLCYGSIYIYIYITYIMCELVGNKQRRYIMAGTKTGGQKAAAKNLARDPFFYAKIGAKGGKNGNTGGFAANPELARIAGAKGGKISRRTKSVK